MFGGRKKRAFLSLSASHLWISTQQRSRSWFQFIVDGRLLPSSDGDSDSNRRPVSSLTTSLLLSTVSPLQRSNLPLFNLTRRLPLWVSHSGRGSSLFSSRRDRISLWLFKLLIVIFSGRVYSSIWVGFNVVAWTVWLVCSSFLRFRILLEAAILFSRLNVCCVDLFWFTLWWIFPFNPIPMLGLGFRVKCLMYFLFSWHRRFWFLAVYDFGEYLIYENLFMETSFHSFWSFNHYVFVISVRYFVAQVFYKTINFRVDELLISYKFWLLALLN